MQQYSNQQEQQVRTVLQHSAAAQCSSTVQNKIHVVRSHKRLAIRATAMQQYINQQEQQKLDIVVQHSAGQIVCSRVQVGAAGHACVGVSAA
jgi:phage/plasmid primase-like uncharacterized protein